MTKRRNKLRDAILSRMALNGESYWVARVHVVHERTGFVPANVAPPGSTYLHPVRLRGSVMLNEVGNLPDDQDVPEGVILVSNLGKP